MAERYYQQARLVASLSGLRSVVRREKMVGLLQEAKMTDPLTGLYAYGLANLRGLQQRNEEAVSLSSEAVLRQPMNFAYLQQLGRLIAPADLGRGRQLLEIGYKRADQKALSFLTWAEFELSRPSGKKGLERLRKELELDARLLRSLYPLLSKYQLDQEEVAAVLPERTSAWIGFWDQMKGEGGQKSMHLSWNVLSISLTTNPRYILAILPKRPVIIKRKKKRQRRKKCCGSVFGICRVMHLFIFFSVRYI